MDREVWSRLCASCSVCAFMPSQEKQLVWENASSPILLVDDRRTISVEVAIATIYDVFRLRAGEFSYTETMRCQPDGPLEADQIREALERCSVWTHNLASERLLLVSTVRGLEQLGVQGKKEGDLFKTLRLGVVLCIPAVEDIEEADVPSLRSRFQRALKEARVYA